MPQLSLDIVKSRDAAAEIAAFIGKYTAEMQSQLAQCRAGLRALFPRGYELVYDNYNALVFAISPSERSSEAMVSIAGYPKWVTLFFLQGARLKDPSHLLQGTGSQVRSIRLQSAAQLEDPAVRSLIAQAVASQELAFQLASPLATIIKSVSDKQRPRRPSAQDMTRPGSNASLQSATGRIKSSPRRAKRRV